MIRDVLIALAVLIVAAVGLSFTDFGRNLTSGLVRPSNDASVGEASAMLEGRAWCFWPEPGGRCAWAMIASAPNDQAFDVRVYAAERAPDGGLRIGVARSGLIASGGRLCQDEARPVTPSRLGYYRDEIGEVMPQAALRLATETEHDAYMSRLVDTGDAEVCFRLEKSEDGEGWLQHALIDGASAGPPDEFVVMEMSKPILLAAP